MNTSPHHHSHPTAHNPRPDTHRTSIGRRSKRRVVAFALFASATAMGVTACDDETTHPPRQDVDTDLSCFVEDGHVRASGDITNHSSKSSFYVLDIEFRLDGETVDHRGASVDDVQPGETTHFEVVSDESDDEITCHVTNVERFKA